MCNLHTHLLPGTSPLADDLVIGNIPRMATGDEFPNDIDALVGHLETAPGSKRNVKTVRTMKRLELMAQQNSEDTDLPRQPSDASTRSDCTSSKLDIHINVNMDSMRDIQMSQIECTQHFGSDHEEGSPPPKDAEEEITLQIKHREKMRRNQEIKSNMARRSASRKRISGRSSAGTSGLPVVPEHLNDRVPGTAVAPAAETPPGTPRHVDGQENDRHSESESEEFSKDGDRDETKEPEMQSKRDILPPGTPLPNEPVVSDLDLDQDQENGNGADDNHQDMDHQERDESPDGAPPKDLDHGHSTNSIKVQIPIPSNVSSPEADPITPRGQEPDPKPDQGDSLPVTPGPEDHMTPVPPPSDHEVEPDTEPDADPNVASDGPISGVDGIGQSEPTSDAEPPSPQNIANLQNNVSMTAHSQSMSESVDPEPPCLRDRGAEDNGFFQPANIHKLAGHPPLLNRATSKLGVLHNPLSPEAMRKMSSRSVMPQHKMEEDVEMQDDVLDVAFEVDDDDDDDDDHSDDEY